jgi:hypothetical protein
MNVDDKCLVMANKIGNLDDQILVDIWKFILIEMLEKCILDFSIFVGNFLYVTLNPQ